MASISVSFGKRDISSMSKDSLEPLSTRKKETKKKLRLQLEELKLQKEELEKVLLQQDSEIIELKKNIEGLTGIITSTPNEDLANGSSIAIAKIVELSKKNRQLTAELEVSKTKCFKAESTVESFKSESEKKVSIEEIKRVYSPCCSSARSLEFTSDELQLTKQKLFEALNRNRELRTSLKLAQKCIQQEIGENVSLHSLTMNSNWRGRAQQIIALQDKMAVLKEKIESANIGDDSTKQEMRRMEAIRKAEYEEWNSQLTVAKATIDDQKVKLSALKTRNKNLADEVTNYKLKTLNLIEQNGCSDKSIEILNEKIHVHKFQYQNKISDLLQKIEDLQNTKQEAEMENAKTQLALLNSEENLKQKGKSIEELLGKIQKLETDLKMVTGDFLFSCRELKKEEFIAILDALESEKIGLVEYSKSLNERLEIEQEKVSSLTDQINKQKTKYVRLEAKLKEYQRETENQQDKKKRSQRIADYSKNLINGVSTTLVIENSNTSIDGKQNVVDGTDLQVEDLKYKLEIAEEKILFLESKLANLLNEKHLEAKRFNEITMNSKNILLNMIQRNKGSESGKIQITEEPFCLNINKLEKSSENTQLYQNELFNIDLSSEENHPSVENI